MLRVSIVVGTYNRLEFLKALLSSLREELADIEHEIIVVDGGSSDGTTEWLIEQKDIITILQHNRGSWLGKEITRKSWGYFMNLGFRAASGKYVCMLSDDCLVVPGAIKNGLKCFDNNSLKNKVGQVAFYWRNWPDQEKYWVGTAWGNRMFVNHGLYLKKALESVDFIDSENYFFYHADGDLSLRLWENGWRCIDSKKSFIEHFHNANEIVRESNLQKQKNDWKFYYNKWSSLGKPSSDWVELEHIDNYKTAEKYWTKDIINNKGREHETTSRLRTSIFKRLSKH